jgi:hypothetical protein
MNEPTEPPRQLEYRASSEEPSQATLVGHAIINCLFVGVLTLVAISMIAAAFFDNVIAGVGALFAIGLWIVLIIRYAIEHAHDPKKKGWVIGIWLGIGVALLLVGTCVVRMSTF